MIINKYPSRLELSLLFLVSIMPIVNWLCHVGFFASTHDWVRPFVFIKHIEHKFQLGEYLFSWIDSINGGYGYPTFVFYPIIFFYASACIMHVLPLNEYHSAMIMVYVLSLISVLNLYYFLTETVVDKVYAWFGVILYIMIPYHYALLYVRGDFSEYMALSLLPMLINSFYRFVIYEHIKYFILMILTLVLGVLSHPIFLTVFIPVFILFIIYFICIDELKLQHLLVFFVGLITALVVTSYYWLNFILLIPEINIKKAVVDFDASSHVMNWYELVNMVRGSEHYYQIGFLYLFLTVITLVQWNRKSHWIFGGLMFLWIISLTKEFYSIIPLWDLPLINNIQFPWRMLGIISLILVIYITNIRLGKKHELFLNLSIYAVLLICLQSSNFMTKWIPQNDIITNQVMTDAKLHPNSIVGAIGSISNEYANKSFLKVNNYAENITESLFKNTQISTVFEKSQEYKYMLEVEKTDFIKVNRMQLSNWIFELDGKPINPETQNGLYFIKVEKGTHILYFYYEKPFNFSMYIVAMITCSIILSIGLYANKFTSKK